MTRALLLQTGTFAALLVALLAVVLGWHSTRSLARDGKQAHDALCVLRADLQRRVDDGRAYLGKHPGGLPNLGISAADIQRSLNNQQSTLDALASLACSSLRKGETP